MTASPAAISCLVLFPPIIFWCFSAASFIPPYCNLLCSFTRWRANSPSSLMSASINGPFGGLRYQYSTLSIMLCPFFTTLTFQYSRLIHRSRYVFVATTPLVSLFDLMGLQLLLFSILSTVFPANQILYYKLVVAFCTLSWYDCFHPVWVAFGYVLCHHWNLAWGRDGTFLHWSN